MNMEDEIKVVKADEQDLKYLEEHGSVLCELGKTSKGNKVHTFMVPSSETGKEYKSFCGIKANEIIETSKGEFCKICLWGRNWKKGKEDARKEWDNGGLEIVDVGDN